MEAKLNLNILLWQPRVDSGGRLPCSFDYLSAPWLHLICNFGYYLTFINFCLFFFLPGFLLDGVTPSAPPDVPPRNPTMNRMNNGRLVAGNPNDLDFEPSCLVRTPSGNVYIPSGNISKWNFNSLNKIQINIL